MKRGFKILNSLLRVYCLHISAILAIWLAMYFPGLDIVLSILYFYLLWAEGKYSQRMLHNHQSQALTALIWQLPGFILVGSVLLSLDVVADFAYYFIFILELWDTPVLPLVSLLPAWTILDRPVYYYLLFLTVPGLAYYYYLAAGNPENRK